MKRRISTPTEVHFPHSLKVIPACFGVNVCWLWPGDRDGKYVAIEVLDTNGYRDIQYVKFPQNNVFIGGLKVGEKVLIRAGIVPSESSKPYFDAEWVESHSEQNLREYCYNLVEGDHLFQVQGSTVFIAEQFVVEQPSEAPAKETFINDALIKDGSVTYAAGIALSSDGGAFSAEEQTLHDVLVEALPRSPVSGLTALATDLANAVKAGFEALRTTDASQS